MTYFWRVWMYQVDPFTRLVGGLVTTVLHGVDVQCKPDEFFTFNAPSGQTCGAYAGTFASDVGAYIDNPDTEGACRYCPYAQVCKLLTTQSALLVVY